jgi:hypothetical protein
LDANALHGLLLANDTLEDFLQDLVRAAARDTQHHCRVTVRGRNGGEAYTVARPRNHTGAGKPERPGIFGASASTVPGYSGTSAVGGPGGRRRRPARFKTPAGGAVTKAPMPARGLVILHRHRRGTGSSTPASEGSPALT